MGFKQEPPAAAPVTLAPPAAPPAPAPPTPVCAPPVRSAVARKREDQASFAFRGNRKVCPQGTPGPKAQRARKSYAERAASNFGEELQTGGFKPPREQSVGDGIALVLTAFHEVMEPTLRDRCIVNEKNGRA